MQQLEKNETLEEFINDTVINCTTEHERSSYHGKLCRMCEETETPIWCLYIYFCEKGKAEDSCGGQYPLNIVTMEDFIKVLNIFAQNNMELEVNTKNYFF